MVWAGQEKIQQNIYEHHIRTSRVLEVFLLKIVTFGVLDIRKITPSGSSPAPTIPLPSRESYGVYLMLCLNLLEHL